MSDACQISAQALVVAGEHIRPGMTTKELDRIHPPLYLSARAQSPLFWDTEASLEAPVFR